MRDCFVWFACSFARSSVLQGTLGFSVTIFSLCAVMCLVVICVRRARLGYELGGDKASPTAAVFVLLWVYYVSMSTLQAYGAQPSIPPPAALPSFAEPSALSNPSQTALNSGNQQHRAGNHIEPGEE